MNRPEQQLQIAVASFLDMALPPFAVWTAINPMPAKTKAAAGLSKAMGLKPGIPDILIIHGGKPYLIELKASDGRAGPEQRRVMGNLALAGANATICRSVEGVAFWLEAKGIPLRARIAA